MSQTRLGLRMEIAAREMAISRPIAALCDITDRYGTMIYLDEVHAVGLYGAHGGGIWERLTLSRAALARRQ
jgi:7-keto-8-aminopelargonate synthetase-like enzyme